MFYKQISGGHIVAVGLAMDTAILPKNFIQISKEEYDSFKRVFSMELNEPKLTPLNEKGELIYASVQN